jgi:thiamine biosynthesis lipoprotein
VSRVRIIQPANVNPLWTGLAVLFFGAAQVTTAADLERYSQTKPHMGVEFEIVLFAPDESQANAAFTRAFARIAELDQKLSDYSLDSELSKLSAQSPTKAPVAVSDDLFTVLKASQELADETGGAFDITIGPLTKLWRRARRQKEVPSDEALAKARASVGYEHLVLDNDQTSVALLKPNMRLDLGGIAKGFAADAALAEIKNLGHSRALVRASGDIVAGDPPPNELGWKVGLAPLNPDEPPTVFVNLANQAISTSGEARQHLIVNGKRYSHLIDPRTGSPLTGRMSITVLAPHSIDADSLASAVAVLGPEKGLKLIEKREGVSAYVVRADDDGGNVMRLKSKRFAERVNMASP